MEREEIVSISSNGGGLSVIVSDYDDDDGANTFKCLQVQRQHGKLLML